MGKIVPTLQRLKTIGGEGDRHCYRLLKAGRRVFLFAKYGSTSFSYFAGRSNLQEARTVAFIKGENQLRHHNNLVSSLQDEFGEVHLVAASAGPTCVAIGRISAGEFLRQLVYLVLMLISGRRRFLSLYLLAFSSSIDRVVAEELAGVETFICYNDQPYDVAAIVYALNRRGNCRTIVVQHGLVLSEKFYFPTIALEFWAWGELSRAHYSAREANATFCIRGRFPVDRAIKEAVAGLPMTSSLLIAPSFFYDEIKDVVKRVDQLVGDKGKLRLAIKLHPATKFKWLLKLWFRRNAPWLKIETGNMEGLAENYDALITKNSTSALDFLLRRKIVFFDRASAGLTYPSLKYGFDLDDAEKVLAGVGVAMGEKDNDRLIFLKNSLNV